MRDRSITAKMEQCLNESDKMKVEVEEMELSARSRRFRG